jgi:hypothetical protein
VRFNKLSLGDKPLFDKFLKLRRHDLAVYSFADIFIWKGLFDIKWSLVRDNLCVFFRDKIGCFLYLPPLAKTIDPEVCLEAFSVMDRFNRNKEISRIENIEGQDADFFRTLGYEIKEKSRDYLCLRSDLAGLKGDKFKSKRASYNYFVKNHRFEYLPYSPKQKKSCLDLYHLWMHQRMLGSEDRVYRGMLEDSLGSFSMLLDNYAKLGCTGRVVRVDGRIKAFTFGYKLNPDTFCILFEITDLTVKGLAQFIFREFAKDLEGFTYINIMDDSGMDNLRRVKLSYHPAKLTPAFIAKRDTH